MLDNDVEGNLATGYEPAAHCMPLDRAINYTWTARMADEWGFQKVRLISIPTGGPGNYGNVKVLFE